MVIHPPAALRPYAVALSGASVAATSAAAVGIGWLLLLGDPQVGPVGIGALACWFVATALLAAGLAGLTRSIHRGPQPSRSRNPGEAASGDLLLAGTFLLTASVFLGGSLSMIASHLAGASDAPAALVWALAGGTGLLGLLLASGFCVSVGNLWLRGPTHLHLDLVRVGPGELLRGRLEVPFAAERALELRIELELLRSVPGPSADDPPEQSVVFQSTTTTLASLPVARRRSAALIEIPLLFTSPCDQGEPHVTYSWNMEVTPLSEPLWWNSILEPPIELARS